MTRISALLLAALPVAAFVAGAWAQDARTRDHYFRQGQIEATWDSLFDSHMIYLGCLADDCSTERVASEIALYQAERRLSELGVRLERTSAASSRSGAP